MKRRGPLVRVSFELNPWWWDVRWWRQKEWGFLLQVGPFIVEWIGND